MPDVSALPLPEPQALHTHIACYAFTLFDQTNSVACIHKEVSL